MSAVLMN